MAQKMSPEDQERFNTLKIILRNRGIKLGRRHKHRKLYLVINGRKFLDYAADYQKRQILTILREQIQEFWPDAYLTSASMPTGEFVFRANAQEKRGPKSNG